MRQFLLCKDVAYGTGTDYNAIADGAVAFFYNKDGKPTVDPNGQNLKKEFNLVLGRTAAKGGPVVIPIYKNNFTFVRSDHHEATPFSATITIPAPTKVGDYTIVCAKKGTLFNERNKWSTTVHVTDLAMTADELCKALAKGINDNSASSGLTAENATATLTIKCPTNGIDWNVIGADNLFGVEVSLTAADTGLNTAKHIEHFASLAAADAGIEYTYQDEVNYLYPNYPLNPLKADDTTDKGFTVFTMRFAEPRRVKTRDEVVNQVVQVAFPTGAAVIDTFETICKALQG